MESNTDRVGIPEKTFSNTGEEYRVFILIGVGLEVLSGTVKKLRNKAPVGGRGTYAAMECVGFELFGKPFIVPLIRPRENRADKPITVLHARPQPLLQLATEVAATAPDLLEAIQFQATYKASSR